MTNKINSTAFETPLFADLDSANQEIIVLRTMLIKERARFVEQLSKLVERNRELTKNLSAVASRADRVEKELANARLTVSTLRELYCQG